MLKRLQKSFVVLLSSMIYLLYLLLKLLVLVSVTVMSISLIPVSLFGLPATADLMLALISTEELEKSGRIIVKQLKNRYNDLTYYRRFTVGIDRSKMKLYNVDDSEGELIASDAPEEETFDRLDDISDRQSRLDKFSQFVI